MKNSPPDLYLQTDFQVLDSVLENTIGKLDGQSVRMVMDAMSTVMDDLGRSRASWLLTLMGRQFQEVHDSRDKLSKLIEVLGGCDFEDAMEIAEQLVMNEMEEREDKYTLIQTQTAAMLNDLQQLAAKWHLAQKPDLEV